MSIQNQLLSMQETFMQKFGKLEERSNSLPGNKHRADSPENQTLNMASQSDATTALTGITKSMIGGHGPLPTQENRTPNADILNLQIPIINIPNAAQPNNIISQKETSKSFDRN